MAGFDNDVLYGVNADYSNALNGTGASTTGQLLTNSQLWIGSTALNAGGTHINVGTITSPLGTVTIGYSSPNITLDITGGLAAVETLSDDTGIKAFPNGSNNIQLPGHVFQGDGVTKIHTTQAGTNLININPMSASRWIVDSKGFNGTHTTIASALASASSGDTIFVLAGTYTENITLVAGVNITAYECDAFTPNVSIVGKCSFASAGTVTLSGLNLQTNSDFALSVTGSAASIVKLRNCKINCTNNTGIQFTTSNVAASIIFGCCSSNLTTTGIALYTMSSTGILLFQFQSASNTGNSLTASSNSAGNVNWQNSISNIVLSTSSGGVIFIDNCEFDTSAINTTVLTTAGTGSSNGFNNYFASGTASAISIGTGTTFSCGATAVNSSNTNAITGVGTLVNSGISLVSSTVINTTTQTAKTLATGSITFDGGTTTLSNYTEGTFTPTMVGTVAGSTTYTNQNGYYRRIGNLVVAQAFITGSAATGTGNIVFGALPFTIKNQTNGNPIGSMLDANFATWTYPVGTTSLALQGVINGTTATCYVSGSGTIGGVMQVFNAAFNFQYTLSFEV